MGLSNNEERFLKEIRRLSKGLPKEEWAEIAPPTDDDYLAFANLKEKGFVTGYTTKLSVAGRVTADGEQALSEASIWARCRAWLMQRITAVIDNFLSHLAALLLGAAIGFFANSTWW